VPISCGESGPPPHGRDEAILSARITRLRGRRNLNCLFRFIENGVDNLR
jgi:hypothetical protein